MVQKFDFWFSPAGENRRIHLYLPEGYDWSDERYPVVYMFDGHNLYFDSDATFGKSLGLKDFLDGWGKKLIVVGIECSDKDLQRVHEYCPFHIHSGIYGDVNGRGDATAAWIVKELKPFIDQRYRTWPFRESTAIAGYSMGGMLALYTVLRYNNWFSKAAVISPSVVPAMDAFRREVRDPLSPDTRIFSAGAPGSIRRIITIWWLRIFWNWRKRYRSRVYGPISSVRKAGSTTRPAGSTRSPPGWVFYGFREVFP